MAFAILDTNVYIDHWEQGAHVDELTLVHRSLIVRHSAVVLFGASKGSSIPEGPSYGRVITAPGNGRLGT